MAKRQYSLVDPRQQHLDLNRTGIYCLTDTRNGRRYVGSASRSFRKRLDAHIGTLNRNVHCNQRLQAIWNLHGPSAFVFSVLLFCEPADCLKREQLFMDHMQTADKECGYNLAPSAGSSLGVKLSDEARANISRGHKGLKRGPQSPEVIAARVARQRGKKRGPLTAEQKKKISVSNSGKVRTPEMRANISKAKKGRPISPAASAKSAATRTGRIASQGHCAAISAALTGKPKSPLHRAKLAAANIGKIGITKRHEPLPNARKLPWFDQDDVE